jgi:predicted transglutaminase-like cysteine proteinase
MPRLGSVAAIAAVQILMSLTVRADPVTPPVQLLHEVEGQPATPPFGFVDFCERSPTECRLSNGKTRNLTLSAQDWVTINDVNRRINSRITAIPDQDLYGVKEYWTLPKDKGDCEDFVLLKQRILTDLGFPENTLLITVVRDEKGEGHAVLTLAASDGDYILDNRRNDIRRWNDAHYTFLKRQSVRNPESWVALAEDQPQPVVASAKSADVP